MNTNTCARPSCSRKAIPGRNRSYCGVHYEALPVKGYVDSGPSRDRVRLLRSRGMTLRMLAENGVSRFGVRLIDSHYRVRALTEQKVFAIPVPAQVGSGAPVDGLGTRRRIQALVAMGWPQGMIGDQLGTKQTAVSALTRRDKVTSQTAIDVADLFDRWGMLSGPSDISRQRARKAGWVSGLAFDDIDDPDEEPNTGVHTRTSFTERIRECREDLGITDIYSIADRLGIAASSVERQLYRNREDAA